MSDLRTAAQQALEAEPVAGKVVAWGVFAKIDGEWQLQHPVFAGDEQGKVNAEFERASYSGPQPLEVRPLGVVTATAQQAEPVEPVAWAAVTENGKLYKAASTRESAERKAEQQEAKFGDTWRPLHVVPLYTAPPQREPLPLKTVEKLIYENTKISPNVADDRELLGYIVNAVRAVERAHGIKE